jgi:hypothetical protein
MSKGCSLQHLNEYKNAINQYLQSKNIFDFSKYDASIKEGKLHYIRWVYEIEKPIDIEKLVDNNRVPKPENYENLFVRKIILHISEKEEIKRIYLNVEGERVDESYIDKQHRYVQKIIEASEYVSGQWKSIGNDSVYLENGLIVIHNSPNRRFVGEIHLIILWYIKESVKRSSALQSLSTKKYYTIPKNYQNY